MTAPFRDEGRCTYPPSALRGDAGRSLSRTRGPIAQEAQQLTAEATEEHPAADHLAHVGRRRLDRPGEIAEAAAAVEAAAVPARRAARRRGPGSRRRTRAGRTRGARRPGARHPDSPSFRQRGRLRRRLRYLRRVRELGFRDLGGSSSTSTSRAHDRGGSCAASSPRSPPSTPSCARSSTCSMTAAAHRAARAGRSGCPRCGAPARQRRALLPVVRRAIRGRARCRVGEAVTCVARASSARATSAALMFDQYRFRTPNQELLGGQARRPARARQRAPGARAHPRRAARLRRSPRARDRGVPAVRRAARAPTRQLLRASAGPASRERRRRRRPPPTRADRPVPRCGAPIGAQQDWCLQLRTGARTRDRPDAELARCRSRSSRDRARRRARALVVSCSR